MLLEIIKTSQGPITSVTGVSVTKENSMRHITLHNMDQLYEEHRM